MIFAGKYEYVLRGVMCMKINFKARLKNKTFIISMAALIVSLIYRILMMFNVLPSVSEGEIADVVSMVVNILALAGVVVDPTTEGFEDSDRAMTYCTCNDVRKIEAEEYELE